MGCIHKPNTCSIYTHVRIEAKGGREGGRSKLGSPFSFLEDSSGGEIRSDAVSVLGFTFIFTGAEACG